MIKNSFLIGVLVSILVVVYWRAYIQPITNIDSVLPGTIINLIALLSSHYLLGEPGGWSKNTNHNKDIDTIRNERKDYIFSQYHSNMGNTGSFMIRKDEYKYIQFGHYLSTFENYTSMLFNVEKDIWEINNLAKYRYSNQTINYIMNEMESILQNEINYEYIDCKVKQNDFKIFEQYFWQKYNQTELITKFNQSYYGFDTNDWNKIIQWRNEMISLGNGSIEACNVLL